MKGCHKKQETEKCLLKLQTWLCLQGAYTPQGGTKKSPVHSGFKLTLIK
jgi:hypothetical protein